MAGVQHWCSVLIPNHCINCMDTTMLARRTDCAARLPARLSDQAVSARSHATVYTIIMIKCPPNEIRYSYRFRRPKTVFAVVLSCCYRSSCIPPVPWEKSDKVQ